MNLSEKLIQLGFTKNQAAVYSSLIELGQCKASEIIKKTGLHRNIVYEALDELVLKRLAFKTSKGGVALFQLSDANTLVNDAQSQLTTAKDIAQEINHLRKKSTHEIKLYEGMNGLKSHRERVLEDLKNINSSEKELLMLGTTPKVSGEPYESFWKKYHEHRAKEGVSARMLFPVESKKQAEARAQIPLTQTKLLPQEMKNPIMIDVWKDNAAFMLFDADPFIISVKNAHLAQSFREYFETLWQQDATVYRGVEGMKIIMEESLKYSDNWFIGGNGGIDRVMPEYWEEYNKRRIAKKVWWHDLVDVGSHLRGVQVLPPGVKDEERYIEFKYLPEEVGSISVIFIYGNFVANIIWDAKPEPIAFVVENTDVVESYKKYFNYLWNQDTFVVTGLPAVQELFYRKMRELKAGEEYVVLGANYGVESKQVLTQWFIEYHAERSARKIKVKLLGFENDQQRLMEEIIQGGDPKFVHTELRFLSDDFTSPMQINIYPDSIMMVYWGLGEKAVAVEIQRKDIQKSMMAYFTGLWNQDTHIITGRENVEKLLHRKLDEMHPGERHYCYGGQYGEKNPEYFFRFWSDFNAKRNAKGNTVQLIGFEHIRKNLLKEVQVGDTEMKNAEVRFLDQELLTPTLTMIYPNSAVIILWDYDEAMAIETTRESARKMLLNHFQSLWKIAKQ
ncbi:MAG: hypothetical protein HYV32_01630 [Candidatus Kerfeldbacteria bacterium]|nr:hypothetical protein [Candidatus Kerfeldbacteria bacterium]